MTASLKGFWTAILTPFDADYRCDLRLLQAHAHSLIRQGCDGVALFGTTGEGPVVAPADRRRILDGLLEGGLAPDRIIVAASAATLDDAAELARHASRAGTAAVMAMPPFLFRDAISDDGVFRYYAALIDRIADPALRLVLYHIPGVSGVAVRPPAIRRLIERYPDTIVGFKDSGGDWGYTEELIRRFSGLAVFTGSELHIHLALRQQGAGTICGLGNAVAPVLRRLFDAPDITARRSLLPLIQRADTILSRGPFIACLKAWLAADTGRTDWLRVMPPMSPLTAQDALRVSGDMRRLLASLQGDAEAAE
jgi:4-hydroxy-tetrahydrodipicolinate synthase